MFILVATNVFISCNKNDEKNTNEKNIFEDKNLQSRVSASKNFTQTYKSLKNITLTGNNLNQNQIENIIKELKNAMSNDEMRSIFNKNSFENSNLMISYFDSYATDMQNLYFEFKADFKDYKASEVSKFIVMCLMDFDKTKIQNTSFHTEDACSSGYSAGMNTCDEQFAIATAGTIVAAAVATVIGTPIAGAGAISTGIGAAYMNDISCRNGVVANWRICRYGH